MIIIGIDDQGLCYMRKLQEDMAWMYSSLDNGVKQWRTCYKIL